MIQRQTSIPLISTLAIILMIGVSQASEPAWAKFEVGSHVAVHTKAGRIVRGAVDRKTNDEHLWLVAEAEGMSVGSRIRREEVLKITAGTEIVLPKLIARPTPMSYLHPATSTHQFNAGVASGSASSLVVFAQLENWNHDAQFDGLGLHFYPRDGAGALAPVGGTLSANLSTFRGDARSTRGAIENSESWTVQVTQANYTQQGGYVRLPFRKLNIESDTLQPVADLQVRFNIAGQGVLEANMENVVIQPFSPTRDLRTLRSRTRS
jgi:hypothetical protein